MDRVTLRRSRRSHARETAAVRHLRRRRRRHFIAFCRAIRIIYNIPYYYYAASPWPPDAGRSSTTGGLISLISGTAGTRSQSHPVPVERQKIARIRRGGRQWRARDNIFLGRSVTSPKLACLWKSKRNLLKRCVPPPPKFIIKYCSL